MSKKFGKTKLIIFTLLLLALSASFIFAAEMETNFPTIAGQKPGVKTTFPEAVIYLFNLSLFVGAIIVLGILIYSGYRYIISRNNPAIVSDIKQKIYSAFLGLLVLVSAYVILKTINPNLVILSLPQLFSPPSSPITQPPEAEKETITFQEIPLGTIIEHILAGNASVAADSNLKCYEYNKSGDTKDLNNDGKIDEKDLKNYSTFYCAKLLNEAFQTKANKIINKTSELRALLNGCSCSKCETYPLATVDYSCITKAHPPSDNCQSCCQTTYSCDSNCSCCGSPGGKSPGCPGTDPCTNRKSINCKRQEIKQLIDGKKLVETGIELCSESYNPDLDPEKNPKVLTLEEAKNRMDAFAKDFINDLNNLKEAEQLMKNPYGERLTMAEFFDLKQNSEKPIESVGFKNYEPKTSDYCREFNCSVKNKQTGACLSCGLNEKTNRMCSSTEKAIGEDEKISEESYSHDGDGATFYFNKEYKDYDVQSISSQEKCVIDPTIGGFGGGGAGGRADGSVGGVISIGLGIQKGLIPIGEAVDETEKFAEKIAALYGLLINSYQKIIDSFSNLNNSPNNCDCGANCTNKPKCSASNCPPCSGNTGCYNQNYNCSGCTDCEPKQSQRDPKNPKQPLTKKEPYECSCVRNFKDWPYKLIPIAESSEYVCPICEFDSYLKKISNTGISKDYFSCCEYYTEKNEKNIEILKAKIKNLSKEDEEQKAKDEYGFCNEKLDTLPGYVQIIENVIEKMDDLMSAKKLKEGDINKCPILEKLTLSREKLETCITGYGSASKEGMTKMRTLSCQEGLDLVYLGKLVILPDFLYVGCYPFTGQYLSATGTKECPKNKDSSACQKEISSFLDNYYCCEGK